MQTAPVRPPVRSLVQRSMDALVWGAVGAALIASFRPVSMNHLPMLFTHSDNMRAFGSAFLHPDFSHLGLDIAQMWLTIQMALWGTAIAILLAIPLGLLCARNITPFWLQQPVRLLINLARSIPDLVLGVLFVVAVGLGPLAGVLALAVNTGAVLAKLFSEAVEAIDPRPVEGVAATGAARLQVIAWGVIPQVAPLWTSYALYRFESSARSATVLGLIGAGGIGQLLFDALNGFAYDQVAAIVIVIVVAVTLIDVMSQALRNRLS